MSESTTCGCRFWRLSFLPMFYSIITVQVWYQNTLNSSKNKEYTKKILMNIINPLSEVLDLGVYISSNYTFDFHVTDLYKRCSNLSEWILKTFRTRKTRIMMTL